MSRNENDPKRTSGRFAYEGLDRIMHERARLSVLSSLAAHPDGLLFTELKTLCSLTDGNLSRQIQQLQESGFVDVQKGFHNNRPQTLCKLSKTGQVRFLEYISVLEAVISDAQAGKKSSRRPSSAGSGFAPAAG